MSFIFPKDWHKDDQSIEADGFSFTWRGPNNSMFAAHISMYKSEYGNGTIENETNSFYQDHKGEEDLRFLEIDGIKGVHYRRDLALGLTNVINLSFIS